MPKRTKKNACRRPGRLLSYTDGYDDALRGQGFQEEDVELVLAGKQTALELANETLKDMEETESDLFSEARQTAYEADKNPKCVAQQMDNYLMGWRDGLRYQIEQTVSRAREAGEEND